MCKAANLFGLPDFPPPPPPETVPLLPLTGEQSEMFEEWEKLGLPSLFKPSETKGAPHV